MQKILEIQGESYQNHFDNLRDKKYEKVDVTPQETILLTDFIQQDEMVANLKSQLSYVEGVMI